MIFALFTRVIGALLVCILLHNQITYVTASSTSRKELKEKWSHEWAFSGVSTFAHLPHVKCLVDPDTEFDIGILGAPFDTAVTYRPGARFGPRSIRAGSSRHVPKRSFNARANINPFTTGATVLDCGDIPITPFDNALALRQMSEAYAELASRKAKNPSLFAPGRSHPRIITLGGDHSIALPELRALSKLYGEPITVLHFDAHLDTWSPGGYDSSWLDDDTPVWEQQSAFTHGTMFWLAWHEGLVANGSVHAGLRTKLGGFEDNTHDTEQGWVRIASDAIDAEELGTKGMAARILEIIGTEKPVLLSIDIDVIDPGLAPATGTPEPGGWTVRELIRVLRGIEALNVIGADLVEVAPAYDTQAEQTSLAAAQIVFEVLTSMVKRIAGRHETTSHVDQKDEL